MLPRAAVPLFLLAAALAQEEAGMAGEAGQEEDAQASPVGSAHSCQACSAQ